MSLEKPGIAWGLAIAAFSVGLGGIFYHEVINFRSYAWVLLPPLTLAALAAGCYVYAQRAALARVRAQITKHRRRAFFPVQVYLRVAVLVFLSLWGAGPILLHQFLDFQEVKTSSAFVIRKAQVEWWRGALKDMPRASSGDHCFFGSYLRVWSDDPSVINELCVSNRLWSKIDVGNKLRLTVKKSQFGRNVADITRFQGSSRLESGLGEGVNNVDSIARKKIRSLKRRELIRDLYPRQDLFALKIGEKRSDGDWSLPLAKNAESVYVVQESFELPLSISLSRYQFVVPKGTERPSGAYRQVTVYDVGEGKCFGPEC